MTYEESTECVFCHLSFSVLAFLPYNIYFRASITLKFLCSVFNNYVLVMLSRKNMYAGGDSTQMNGDTPHSGGQGGGGHAVGDELKRTGK